MYIMSLDCETFSAALWFYTLSSPRFSPGRDSGHTDSPLLLPLALRQPPVQTPQANLDPSPALLHGSAQDWHSPLTWNKSGWILTWDSTSHLSARISCPPALCHRWKTKRTPEMEVTWWDFLGVQRLRLCLSMQGAQVRCLVREWKSHLPWGGGKKLFQEMEATGKSMSRNG